MARVDNIEHGALDELLRRVRALETATPLSNASVGRGRLRMHDNSELLIEDGNLTVSGAASITGTLQVTGQLDADGTVTLTGDLTVNGGGEIVIAGSVPMTLGITSNGRPGIEFAGGRMSSDGSKIALESGSSTVGAAGTFASISAGSYAIIAQTDGAYILNLPTTTNSPNLYVDPATGKLYRTNTGGI